MAKKTTATSDITTDSSPEKINADLLPLVKPISSLTLDPHNARKHGDSDLQSLAASIKIHGQQKPIVIDTAGKVIAGNGTMQAARDILGWTKIAAITFDGDSESAAKAFAITDNRVAELSSWDFDELRSSLSSIDEEMVNSLGFSQKELAGLLEDVDGDLKKQVEVTNHTREITEIKASTVTCPKCGFEFDE